MRPFLAASLDTSVSGTEQNVHRLMPRAKLDSFVREIILMVLVVALVHNTNKCELYNGIIDVQVKSSSNAEAALC